MEVAASGGDLRGEYIQGAELGDDVHRFRVGGGGGSTIGLTGSGRLAGSGAAMQLIVDGDARVLIRVFFPAGNQESEGSAVPGFRLENDAQCPSGRRLTTRLGLTLEYLGKTTIVDTHCTAVRTAP